MFPNALVSPSFLGFPNFTGASFIFLICIPRVPSIPKLSKFLGVIGTWNLYSNFPRMSRSPEKGASYSKQAGPHQYCLLQQSLRILKRKVYSYEIFFGGYFKARIGNLPLKSSKRQTTKQKTKKIIINSNSELKSSLQLGRPKLYLFNPINIY